MTCFGIDYDDEAVCSYSGNCLSQDSCTCTGGSSGETCSDYSCYGINHDEASVCSGNGECVSKNKCECDENYSGVKCENFHFHFRHQDRYCIKDLIIFSVEVNSDLLDITWTSDNPDFEFTNLSQQEVSSTIIGEFWVGVEVSNSVGILFSDTFSIELFRGEDLITYVNIVGDKEKFTTTDEFTFSLVAEPFGEYDAIEWLMLFPDNSDVYMEYSGNLLLFPNGFPKGYFEHYEFQVSLILNDQVVSSDIVHVNILERELVLIANETSRKVSPNKKVYIMVEFFDPEEEDFQSQIIVNVENENGEDVITEVSKNFGNSVIYTYTPISGTYSIIIKFLKGSRQRIIEMEHETVNNGLIVPIVVTSCVRDKVIAKMEYKQFLDAYSQGYSFNWVNHVKDTSKLKLKRASKTTEDNPVMVYQKKKPGYQEFVFKLAVEKNGNALVYEYPVSCFYNEEIEIEIKENKKKYYQFEEVTLEFGKILSEDVLEYEVYFYVDDDRFTLVPQSRESVVSFIIPVGHTFTVFVDYTSILGNYGQQTLELKAKGINERELSSKVQEFFHSLTRQNDKSVTDWKKKTIFESLLMLQYLYLVGENLKTIDEEGIMELYYFTIELFRQLSLIKSSCPEWVYRIFWKILREISRSAETTTVLEFAIMMEKSISGDNVKDALESIGFLLQRATDENLSKCLDMYSSAYKKQLQVTEYWESVDEGVIELKKTQSFMRLANKLKGIVENTVVEFFMQNFEYVSDDSIVTFYEFKISKNLRGKFFHVLSKDGLSLTFENNEVLGNFPISFEMETKNVNITCQYQDEEATFVNCGNSELSQNNVVVCKCQRINTFYRVIVEEVITINEILLNTFYSVMILVGVAFFFNLTWIAFLFYVCARVKNRRIKNSTITPNETEPTEPVKVVYKVTLEDSTTKTQKIAKKIQLAEDQKNGFKSNIILDSKPVSELSSFFENQPKKDAEVTLKKEEAITNVENNIPTGKVMEEEILEHCETEGSLISTSENEMFQLPTIFLTQPKEDIEKELKKSAKFGVSVSPEGKEEWRRKSWDVKNIEPMNNVNKGFAYKNEWK